MPAEEQSPRSARPGHLFSAIALTAPGSLLGLSELLHLDGPEPAPAVQALLYGLAVVGAAFLLAWAAEAAQIDVSASLAIGALALVAVLPEYAVGFVFAWKGGNDVERYGASCRPPGAAGEDNCTLVLANMTGANRLLIGVGWALVVLVAWWRWRSRGERRQGIVLGRSKSVELGYLALACAYSLTLPLKQSVSLIDAAVLVAIFVAYVVRISRAPAEEPDLIGPAAWLGGLPRTARRRAVGGLFLLAATVILLVAEHFAESLKETGAQFGVSEFVLVQWVAPLASEAPELLVAGLFAWRLKTDAALTTLVSSKVNQWTLLVGTLPVVFAVASGSLGGLPMDDLPRQEVLLTAAQTVFALAVLVNLELSVREALALFGLFWAQFLIGALVPASAHGVELIAVAAAYLLAGLVLIIRNLGVWRQRLWDGFHTPYEILDPDEPISEAEARG
ncbi:MAG TPA: sodium:proton exchanger [Actinomycetota bacterium]|nr:sodium:proton exchanger [Actinomycetota bacterium]